MTDRPLKPEILTTPPRSPGLEQMAWLMDRAIQIPGTRITVGLDAILGLLPFGGDVLTGLIQAGIVVVAMAHYRVPRAVAVRMAANVLLDVALGSIPIVGDAFDVFFKANTRNMKLLNEVERTRAKGHAYSSRSSVVYLVLIGVAFLVILALLLVGFAVVVAWIIKQL